MLALTFAHAVTSAESRVEMPAYQCSYHRDREATKAVRCALFVQRGKDSHQFGGLAVKVGEFLGKYSSSVLGRGLVQQIQ